MVEKEGPGMWYQITPLDWSRKQVTYLLAFTSAEAEEWRTRGFHVVHLHGADAEFVERLNVGLAPWPDNTAITGGRSWF